MNKLIKKLISVVLTITMLAALLSVTIVVNAEESGQVRVIVRNDVYSVEGKTPWEGVLVDEWVNINEDSSMATAIVTALDNNGYSQTGAENNFITEINGLGTFDMNCWMCTLNDWFTNQGVADITVADGELESGDEICVWYSTNWGADIGSLWDSNDTTLKALSFSTGELNEEFTPSVTDYTLTIPADASGVVVTPTAFNKNFQVRTYKNEYTPTADGTEYKRNAEIEVSDGDKIIIGVGNSEWPSMNVSEEETVYTITVKTADIEESGQVRVIVRNDVYSVEGKTPWEGVLVDEWVNINEDSSMATAIVTALDNNGYSQTGAENNFITEINGLGTFDMNCWMCTLNDWFTNQGVADITVADGELESGDEICVWYSTNWGADIGSLWDSNDTTLKALSFSTGELNEEFTPSVTDYTLTIPADASGVVVTPTAFNKNFQVRTYKNEYTPTADGTEYKRNAEIEVSDGDKIIIGVGNSEWPSMNVSEGETVYTITVKTETVPILGDVDLNGHLSVLDATLVQKYLAALETMSDEQLALADVNNDGRISVLDATEIQKIIAA